MAHNSHSDTASLSTDSGADADETAVPLEPWTVDEEASSADRLRRKDTPFVLCNGRCVVSASKVFWSGVVITLMAVVVITTVLAVVIRHGIEIEEMEYATCVENMNQQLSVHGLLPVPSTVSLEKDCNPYVRRYLAICLVTYSRMAYTQDAGVHNSLEAQMALYGTVGTELLRTAVNYTGPCLAGQ